MQEEPLLDDIENQLRDEFIDETYDYVAEKNKRTNGVFPDDFLCDMFCVNQTYWWMEENHPIARMLKQNDFEIESSTTSKFGTIVVYNNEYVMHCLGCIVDLCEKYGKVIIKNGRV